MTELKQTIERMSGIILAFLNGQEDELDEHTASDKFIERFNIEDAASKVIVRLAFFNAGSCIRKKSLLGKEYVTRITNLYYDILKCVAMNDLEQVNKLLQGANN